MPYSLRAKTRAQKTLCAHTYDAGLVRGACYNAISFLDPCKIGLHSDEGVRSSES